MGQVAEAVRGTKPTNKEPEGLKKLGLLMNLQLKLFLQNPYLPDLGSIPPQVKSSLQFFPGRIRNLEDLQKLLPARTTLNRSSVNKIFINFLLQCQNTQQFKGRIMAWLIVKLAKKQSHYSLFLMFGILLSVTLHRCIPVNQIQCFQHGYIWQQQIKL